MTSDKILIFRNQGIGDLILISPAVRAIRKLHSGSEISVFAGDWSKSALEGNPNIDKIISYPDPWIQNKKPFRILQLIDRIRREHFRRVYIFHSHNMLHLMVWLAGIPERYGFSYRGTGKLLTHTTEWDPNSSRYIADNYLDIPRLAGYEGSDLSLDFKLSEQSESEARNIMKSNDLSERRYFVIAPGGGVNPRQNVFEKRWGEEKFVEFIKVLSGHFSSKIVLVGAPAEKSICKHIENISGVLILNLCGKTSFKVSAALVKYSRALICNDSSLMHTAVAFGVPSTAVFGPSNPKSLLPESKLNRWVSSGVDCSPCYCNSIFTGCRRNLDCMKTLHPEKVFTVLTEALNARKSN